MVSSRIELESILIKSTPCFHEYIITESGKHLRKGFQMLTERKYFYYEIVDYLMQRGV
jgi:hypothetical protein